MWTCWNIAKYGIFRCDCYCEDLWPYRVIYWVVVYCMSLLGTVHFFYRNHFPNFQYVGESRRCGARCSRGARDSSPCVIFFDEIDALIRREVTRRLVGDSKWLTGSLRYWCLESRIFEISIESASLTVESLYWLIDMLLLIGRGCMGVFDDSSS